jgi:hypothetical protein
MAKEKDVAIPEGLLKAVKDNIITMNGAADSLRTAMSNAKTQKEKDNLQKKLTKFTESVEALKESQITVITSNPTTKVYVVETGSYGIRKVQL